MKTGGILSLIASIITVTSLFVFTLFRVEVSPGVYVYASGIGLLTNIGNVFSYAMTLPTLDKILIISFEIIWLIFIFLGILF